MPFVLRIGLVFLLNLVLGVVVTKFTEPPYKDQPVVLSDITFTTDNRFNVAAIAVTLLLGMIYATFW